MTEYCIMHHAYPDEAHRGPWPLEECQAWILEWEQDGGRGSGFYVASREVSPWQAVRQPKG